MFAEDIHKKTPACFLPFGHQLVTPEEKTKYMHLKKIFLMTRDSDF